jgi:hypothetical protein
VIKNYWCFRDHLCPHQGLMWHRIETVPSYVTSVIFNQQTLLIAWDILLTSATVKTSDLTLTSPIPISSYLKTEKFFLLLVSHLIFDLSTSRFVLCPHLHLSSAFLAVHFLGHLAHLLALPWTAYAIQKHSISS